VLRGGSAQAASVEFQTVLLHQLQRRGLPLSGLLLYFSFLAAYFYLYGGYGIFV